LIKSFSSLEIHYHTHLNFSNDTFLANSCVANLIAESAICIYLVSSDLWNGAALIIKGGKNTPMRRDTTVCTLGTDNSKMIALDVIETRLGWFFRHSIDKYAMLFLNIAMANSEWQPKLSCHKISDSPNFSRYSGFHRWRNPQRTVNPAEIVIGKV